MSRRRRRLFFTKRQGNEAFCNATCQFALHLLDSSGVVRPVKQRLALLWSAGEVGRATMFLNLRFVSPDCAPAFYLAFIIRTPAADEVSAIPLKPPSGIFFIDPPLFDPNRKWLRSIHLKEIQLGVGMSWRQLGLLEPFSGKLGGAVGHVFAAKHAEFQHLSWSQLRMKTWMKVSACRLGEKVFIAPLHEIIDYDQF